MRIFHSNGDKIPGLRILAAKNTLNTRSGGATTSQRCWSQPGTLIPTGQAWSGNIIDSSFSEVWCHLAPHMCDLVKRKQAHLYKWCGRQDPFARSQRKCSHQSRSDQERCKKCQNLFYLVIASKTHITSSFPSVFVAFGNSHLSMCNLRSVRVLFGNLHLSMCNLRSVRVLFGNLQLSMCNLQEGAGGCHENDGHF